MLTSASGLLWALTSISWHAHQRCQNTTQCPQPKTSEMRDAAMYIQTLASREEKLRKTNLNLLGNVDKSPRDCFTI